MKRVLVLRALGLGDLCTAVPALRGIRSAFPRHRLLLAAPAWQEPLARTVGVDAVVPVDGVRELPRSLPASFGGEVLRGVDVAVNLHGRGPQSSRLLEELDPGRLIAFRHRAVPGTGRGPEWRADEHEVERWCRLLEEAGVACDPHDLRLPVPDATRAGTDLTEGAVVVHPGAVASARRWPAERFAEVVRRLAATTGRRIAITGVTSEEQLCERVAHLASSDEHPPPQVDVLAGRTTLVELASLIATAAIVISNDTGVAHLATAYAVPSVVLFGPTPPSRWGPPPGGLHRALWKGRSGDAHSDVVHPGLLAIEPDEVLDAVDDVLATAVTTGVGEHRGG